MGFPIRYQSSVFRGDKSSVIRSSPRRFSRFHSTPVRASVKRMKASEVAWKLVADSFGIQTLVVVPRKRPSASPVCLRFELVSLSARGLAVATLDRPTPMQLPACFRHRKRRLRRASSHPASVNGISRPSEVYSVRRDVFYYTLPRDRSCLLHDNSWPHVTNPHSVSCRKAC